MIRKRKKPNYDNIELYSDFSHEAAQHGGVESYLDELQAASHDLGAAEQKSKDAMFGVIGTGVGFLVAGVIYLIRQQKRIAEEKQRIESARESIKEEVKEPEKVDKLVITDSEESQEDDE